MYIEFFLKIKHASLERTVRMPAPAKLVRAVSKPNKIDPQADCDLSPKPIAIDPRCRPHTPMPAGPTGAFRR